jgi:hypothetical protein
MTLAQAPAGLQAAVRRALGPSAASSSVSQQAELTATDGASGDQFGDSVAIYGSTAVVGAPLKNSSTGAAYVFVRSGDAWSEQAELTPSGAAGFDQFGSSVAIYGSTAVIGAPLQNSSTGAAYVFVRSSAGWSQQAELTAPDGGSFGSSVAISGSTAVIGSPSTNSSAGRRMCSCDRGAPGPSRPS